MSYPYTSEESVDFWVWIDPNNFLVRHNIEAALGCSAQLETCATDLM